MHLVVEKYQLRPDFLHSPQPIWVSFLRDSRDCVVNAIVEFLDYNFEMNGPPQYRDSDGEMVVLENKEAFEVAVDDIMQTSLKLFIMHVDGTYKHGLPKTEYSAASVGTYLIGVLQTQFASVMDENVLCEVKNDLANLVVASIGERLNEVITQHPGLVKLEQFVDEARKQKPLDLLGQEVRPEQNAVKANFSSSASNKACLEEVSKLGSRNCSKAFRLVEQSSVFSGKGLSDLSTGCEEDGIFFKQWILHRPDSPKYVNVMVAKEYSTERLEIVRSKLNVTLCGESQTVQFSVWVRSTGIGLACAIWQLYTLDEGSMIPIPEGPYLRLQIHSLFVGQPVTFSNQDESFSNVSSAEDLVEEEVTQSVENLTHSTAASDFEVVVGDDVNCLGCEN
ncbi:unnamed protein product [Thelazia callipaeda]|uniref:BTB/POZ domain-containing protein n=1 Tax=Thelazia callipaeda TaxID=103827 RepID=A0A0N5DAX1_THECL|nr:unnamed protein product [Thelazia callipaeda]